MIFSESRRKCSELIQQCYINRVKSGIPGGINIFWIYVNCIRGDNNLPTDLFYDIVYVNNGNDAVNLFATVYSTIREVKRF